MSLDRVQKLLQRELALRHRQSFPHCRLVLQQLRRPQESKADAVERHADVACARKRLPVAGQHGGRLEVSNHVQRARAKIDTVDKAAVSGVL